MKICIASQLEEISKIRSRKQKIARIHDYSTPQLKTLLDFTFNPKIKWILPEGNIEYKPSEETNQNLNYRLYQETKKMYIFVNIGPYKDLDPKIRLEKFIDIIQTLHPKDAELLMYMKDKKLPWSNLTKDLFAEAFPILSENWKTDDNT